MATFVSDTFTDSAGTNVTSHTGEVGATWTQNTSLSSSPVISDANAARLATAGNASRVHASGAPLNADYDVAADFIFKTVTESNKSSWAFLCARSLSSADTCYEFGYNLNDTGTPNHMWQVYKVIGGSYTDLGSFSEAITAGTTHPARMSWVGSNYTAARDGVVIISGTDSGIVATNTAGFGQQSDFSTSIGNTSGIHIDNFSANDPDQLLPQSVM